MGRYRRLEIIRSLDPVEDHWEIYRLSASFEFPWDYRKALEFALFRTYAVPSISALLDKTREFAQRPQRRYDDTLLLMGALTEHGYDSASGRAALQRINQMHGRYEISNEDMLYVLSTFVYEPIRWLAKYGWRALHEHERLAAFHFYREVGRRMGIKDIPAGYGKFETFNRDYEREHFHYRDTNERVGTATVDLFCSWYPAFGRPAVRRALYAAMDEPLLRAFGFPRQPAWLEKAVERGLAGRGRLVRHLPVRRHSRSARDPGNRTYPGYPEGYRITDLGVPPQ
ncbi:MULTISPECIES: oxygenase MpaB family protein [unclassified Crossiella]|uniref:oxygenase MpaB family protein n=1 Tax=unclassified Crossiella TaxID=2620835 RepID=UPI001FFED473|nr:MULTISPECIES: oxygenase MpaB family protein [unclassified Crossiella]MCK2237244.1 DUF2236 domain-containing protein [Crossiella sp. S99.2]MCK2250899.1 DUF2236 domain-containing protein [Crossiella sp. S99.1]